MNDKILMTLYPADLHIHTVLSPCAEVEMIPPLIIQQAQSLGLRLIGIMDHNACLNAQAVIQAAEGTDITVFPGMELQTREEVHLLCLFDRMEAALQWQEKVFQALPNLKNNEEFFGPQYIVDEVGDYISTEDRMLATSTYFSLEEAIAGVHESGGLAIPSHVDRETYSLFHNLGLIPNGLMADAMEISRHFKPMEGFQRWPQLEDWPLIMDGDAHQLSSIACNSVYQLEAPTLAELKLALLGKEGRKIQIRLNDRKEGF
jgi:PHP family Zn ribbon phosphoesterase